MKAVILCAGLGTRLRPLTAQCPKPAIPFCGIPLFRYALSTLARAGIREVGINTFFCPELMHRVAHQECLRFHMRLTVSQEVEGIRGTGGGIAGLSGFWQGGPLVVLNGDVLSDIDVSSAVESHLKSGAPATMVLMPMPTGEKYNAVEVDGMQQVRAIANKGRPSQAHRSFHFTGMHVISPDVDNFEAKLLARAHGPFDINHDFYVPMLERGERINAHVASPKVWADLGTPQRYLKAHLEALNERSLLSGFAGVHAFERPMSILNSSALRFNESSVFIGEGAEVHPQASVGNGVFVATNARVEAGAKLESCVLLEGAVVKAGASLKQCIAMSDGTVVDAA